jgi:hypothetical protein
VLLVRRVEGTISLVAQTPATVRAAIEVGDVIHLDTARKEIPDEFVVFAIRSGVLETTTIEVTLEAATDEGSGVVRSDDGTHARRHARDASDAARYGRGDDEGRLRPHPAPRRRCVSRAARNRAGTSGRRPPDPGHVNLVRRLSRSVQARFSPQPFSVALTRQRRSQGRTANCCRRSPAHPERIWRPAATVAGAFAPRRAIR